MFQQVGKAMKKTVFTFILAVAATFSVNCAAGTLARNPWAQTVVTQEGFSAVRSVTAANQNTQQGVIYVRVDQGSQPIQAFYEGGDQNIWNTPMPEFTGRLTTWGDNYGQIPNAPEVNMHNILSITQHLRRMGYKIPDSLEARIKAAPAATKRKVMGALSQVRRSNNVTSKVANFAMDSFESETGLSVDNLLGNSLDLISSK